MKIDRIIVSVDDNPNYQAYWPYFAKACVYWLGLTPVLVWVASNPKKEFPYPSEYGTVIVLPQLPRVNVAFQSKLCRWIAAATMTGINTMNDIDMLFLSSRTLLPYQSVPDDANFVVWSNSDPKFLREDRLLEDESQFIPMIFSGFWAGDREALQTVFATNGIDISSTGCLQDVWNNQLASQILDIPRNYLGYPSAVARGSQYKYFSDQRYMNQLYHHHYMVNKTAKLPFWYPLTGMHSNCTFGESRIWWPSATEIKRARQALQEGNKLDVDLSLYDAIHWYRDSRNSPTLELLFNYIQKEKSV